MWMGGAVYSTSWAAPLKAITAPIAQVHSHGPSMADKSKFIDYIDEALEKSKETALSRLFFTHQGIPYPVTMCTSETFQALDTFEARRDDILLASYPKCGN